MRHGRMLVSPFAYYRGAALPMAADPAGTRSSGLRVQLCGDAHLSNFGAFASPERRLVFDLNDFDETLPGPFEWDVKRLVASFEVMGRFRGFSPDNRYAIVTSGVREYRQQMRRAAVGVGSVGTRCYILLFTGRDEDDPLFLQVKEAQASLRLRDRASCSFL